MDEQHTGEGAFPFWLGKIAEKFVAVLVGVGDVFKLGGLSPEEAVEDNNARE